MVYVHETINIFCVATMKYQVSDDFADITLLNNVHVWLRWSKLQYDLKNKT